MISDINTKKICLWEYDLPVRQTRLINHSAGIWKWCITPYTVIVTDDNGNTGYYDYNNATLYNIKSLVVDGNIYLKVTDLIDLETQDEAFYFDVATQTLYLTFTLFGTWLQQAIFIGAVVGFSKESDSIGNVFSNNYYKPLIKSVTGIKKSKDPLFYGLLKFNTGTIKLINNEGEFDSWREQRSYRQPTRLLLGEMGDDYADFIRVGSGVIGEHSRSWEDFSIKFEDARTVLTNKLPKNKLALVDYPDLEADTVGQAKPIAYGSINNAKCICLVDPEDEPAVYSFLFVDTEYHIPTSLGVVKVDGVTVTPASVNLAAGTFTLTSAQAADSSSSVTASFVMPISNGVEIIKDLMKNYASTDYIDGYYDLIEVAQAVIDCSARVDSLYIKEESDVKKSIEKVCVDIDGLFFQHDGGLWTVRIYDSERVPVKTIEFDEILDTPSIEGNEEQFLSSCIVNYNKNQDAGTFTAYENTVYEDEVFAEYKALQSKTFETGLTDEASAILKSESIMEFSKYIEDIVKIKVGFQFYDLEIMDFVICDPRRRISGIEHKAVWEVIELSKDFNNYQIQLSLKYVKQYIPVVTLYSTRITDDGEYRILSDGSVRMVSE